MTAWQFGSMQMFGYDLIVADPPWDFENYSDAGTAKGADPHYQVMSLDAIKALRVGELAARDCLLLMWTCGWTIATGQAQQVAAAWGFRPLTEIVWRKTTTSGKVRMGTGYRVRTCHEPILLCVTGNPTHEPFLSCFDGIARQHSRKPEEFYRMVDACCPNLQGRADLFSRKSRPGYDGWGHQTGKFDDEGNEAPPPPPPPPQFLRAPI